MAAADERADVLRDTIEIEPKTEHRFWKFPNQNDYSNWVPQVRFLVYYDNSVKLRYTAEWFNPDGSPWFSEPLEVLSGSADKTTLLRSAYSNELFQSKSVVATGTYGLKITNSKSGEVVFQGKFKVSKTLESPGEPRLKNRFMFYADNDWNLSIGYVGFDLTGTNYDTAPKPIVFMWFKGNLETKDMEARLFHNNQQITSTDDGGNINYGASRGEGCFLTPELCKYRLWEFKWDKFIVENNNWIRTKYPKAAYSRDKPGEYTVKIFYRGVQVREAKFNIDSRGWIAPNTFSSQMYLTNYKVAVPVKVIGTLDKWNPATARSDAFYGNPLTGFAVP